jgi:hypothetical protein
MISDRKINILLKFIGIGIPSSFLILGIVYIFLVFNGKRLVNKYAHNEHVYVIDTFHNALNLAYYVSRSSDTSALIAFYSEVEKGNNPAINFEIGQFGFNSRLRLENDASLDGFSKAVEFIIIDTSSVPYNIERGYVYRNSIHTKPVVKSN